MRKISLGVMALFWALILDAQVVGELKRVGAKKRIALDSNGWRQTGMLVININQSAQQNWGSGGETFQLGVNTILNHALHHKKGKYTFDAYFDIELGLVESASFKGFRKTNDRCDITLELEHSIGKKGKGQFNYGILGNFNTQLFRGRNYALPGQPKISNFLSPGKMLLSFGVDYKNTTKKHYFSVFATPATVRWVTKVDPEFIDQKRFGVDSGRKVYTEIGAYITFHYNERFSKSVSLISRLDLFSNYKRDPQNVDILFNNVLTFNITKFLAGTFLFDLVYDHDFKRKTQIQQITGFGMRLKL